MPIVIKEIFSSDPISEALEKINFNFDQLILSGGGPAGVAGVAGPPGVPGAQGLRGDHWQVGGSQPTTDHGPNFGNLQIGDSWMDALGTIWRWNGTIWSNTSINVVGPTGPVGPTGNSQDLNIYLGSTSSVSDGTSFVPRIGPTSTISTNVDFYTLNNIDKNSFFLGDPSWAYNRLINFANLDLISGLSSVATQRMVPKSVVIQSGIDSTGYGGFAIGAYGLTGGNSNNVTPFLGGNSQAGIVNGRAFFNAGWTINNAGTPLSPDYSHIFRMKTGFNDMEIQSGDANSLLGNASRKLTLSSNTVDIKGLNDAGELVRFSAGATYSRFRDLLAIGFNSIQVASSLQNLITRSDSSKLIVNGNTRISGDLYVGVPSNQVQQIGIGYKRNSPGESTINFYSNSSANTTSSFFIKREDGANGAAFIKNVGTGNLNIEGPYSSKIALVSTGTNIGSINLVANGNSGNYIRFTDDLSAELARFDTFNMRFGVGTTTPQTKVHIKADNGEPRVLRLEGNTGAQIELYSQGSSTRSGWIGYNGFNNNLGLQNDIAGGHSFLAVKPTANPLLTYYAGLQENGVFSVGSNTVLGTITNESIINVNTGGTGAIYLGDSQFQPGTSWKIYNTPYYTLPSTNPNFPNEYTGEFRIGNGPQGAINTRVRINASNGNFGIGVTGRTGPIKTLHVSNTGDYLNNATILIEGNNDSTAVSGDFTELTFYPKKVAVDMNYRDLFSNSLFHYIDAIYGRYGAIGYREESSSLWITSSLSKVVGNAINGSNIVMGSSNHIYFRTGFNSIADPSDIKITSNDTLTLIGGRDYISAGYKYENPRVGINTATPENGYALDVRGKVTIDNDLRLGSAASSNIFMRNASPTVRSVIKTEGASLAIGGATPGIFIAINPQQYIGDWKRRTINGNICLGYSGVAQSLADMYTPRAALQVNLRVPDWNLENLKTPPKFVVRKYCGYTPDFTRSLVLLHKAATSVTNSTDMSYVKGTFYFERGSAGADNINHSIEIDTNSSYAYNSANLTVKTNKSGFDVRAGKATESIYGVKKGSGAKLVIVDVYDEKWVALYPGYLLQAHTCYYTGEYANSSQYSVQDGLMQVNDLEGGDLRYIRFDKLSETQPDQQEDVYVAAYANAVGIASFGSPNTYSGTDQFSKINTGSYRDRVQQYQTKHEKSFVNFQTGLGFDGRTQTGISHMAGMLVTLARDGSSLVVKSHHGCIGAKFDSSAGNAAGIAEWRIFLDKAYSEFNPIVTIQPVTLGESFVATAGNWGGSTTAYDMNGNAMSDTYASWIRFNTAGWPTTSPSTTFMINVIIPWTGNKEYLYH